MVYIMYGQDDFSIRETIRKIKNGLGDKELLDCNTTVFDGANLTLNQLMGACDIVPFMASGRLIIVSGLIQRFEKRETEKTVAKHQSKTQENKDWNYLPEYTGRMPPTTTLILVDETVSRSNQLFKALASKAEVHEYPLFKMRELQEWILNRVIQSGGDITPAALRLLADYVGANLWVLSSEIEKLCIYKAGKRIEDDDIRTIVSYTRESNIFSLIDAMNNKQIAQALSQLHRLLDDGAAPQYLLFMITRQFRMLLLARELTSMKIPPDEIATQLEIRSDFAFRKIIEQSRSYSTEQLKIIYDALLEADLSVKIGKYEPGLSLDILLVDLCRIHN